MGLFREIPKTLVLGDRCISSHLLSPSVACRLSMWSYVVRALALVSRLPATTVTYNVWATFSTFPLAPLRLIYAQFKDHWLQLFLEVPSFPYRSPACLPPCIPVSALQLCRPAVFPTLPFLGSVPSGDKIKLPYQSISDRKFLGLSSINLQASTWHQQPCIQIFCSH